MTQDFKIDPEAIDRAKEAAKTWREQMDALGKALDTSSLEKTISKISEMQMANIKSAIQFQEYYKAIAASISEPLAQMSETLRSSIEPISNLQLKIDKNIANFTANTAVLQSFSQTSAQLQDINANLTGKKSEYQKILKTVAKRKSELGLEPVKFANKSRELIQQDYVIRKQQLDQNEIDAKLATEKLDLTLPPPSAPKGSIHPVSQVMDELAEIFADLGFSVATGPEIEDDWHNFTALNIPETHPARAMHDTFYFPQTDEGGMAKLLRTHTSPVQIRTMMDVAKQTDGAGEPIYLIAPGRTYRSDSDATHTPMFHQVEGLVIDKGIHMGHLKWTLETFIRAFFERDDIELRLRPSYFPFTEPSAEVDVGFSVEKGRRIIGGDPRGDNGGWMEILGSGMVHPNVIRNCGLDPDVWQGFAFGCGIDRLAMLKYGMDDLRAFFDGDLRWADHYGFDALDVPTLSGGVGA